MSARIEASVRPMPVDVKRFYMPGVKLYVTCPECSAEECVDFGDDYLSYPDANAPFMHGVSCRACEHEWEVKLQLTVSLAVVS